MSEEAHEVDAVSAIGLGPVDYLDQWTTWT